MYRMSGFRSSRALIASILLLLLFNVGCSRRSPDLPGEGGTRSSQTPFQSQETSVSDNALVHSLAKDNGQASPPFENSQILPAGSLLTVTLKEPMVARTGFKDSFEALVDDPVTVDGNVVIPRGASVSGRIESAGVSNVQPNRGFVRLALESVRADNANLRVQTASLFARQLPQTNAKSSAIRLEKGRRLTFRLTEPIYFATQSAKTDR